MMMIHIYLLEYKEWAYAYGWDKGRKKENRRKCFRIRLDK